jgi:choline dehydrogenase
VFTETCANTSTLLTAIGYNDIPGTLDWARDHYTPSHHWYGTNRMGTSVSDSVVDSSGRVFGVTGLRVADASILPVKPDGNTQMPAYLVGATIVEKMLREVVVG